MSKKLSLENVKGKRISNKKVAETNARIKAAIEKQKKPLKLKEVKLNELIVVDGYVYMFVKPNTPLAKTDDNGLMLITVEILKEENEHSRTNQ
jgi:hypothetical protein